MKVLLVAYACEPGKGSEPGIGWDWALGLARIAGLEVTVITRANNRAPVEAALAAMPPGCRPGFEYHDLPRWLTRWKKGRMATYPYYVLWCLSLRPVVRRTACARGVDVLHHLTFSTDWLPGAIPADAGCATVLGPLAGYDTPAALRGFAAPRHRCADALKKRIRAAGLRLRRREFARCDAMIANNPGFAAAYARAADPSAIHLVSTQLSSGQLSSGQLSSGQLSSGQAFPTPAPSETPPAERLVVTAGRIVYWKGFDAALDGLAAWRDRGGSFRAVIVGTGARRYVEGLRMRAAQLGLDDRIEFRAQMPREDFLALLGKADAFLYPTFYGTADSIMMEAVERHVPVVCFPSQGAKELLGDDYPHMAAGFTATDLADRLAAADRHSALSRRASADVAARHAPDVKLGAVAAIYRAAQSRFRARAAASGGES